MINIALAQILAKDNDRAENLKRCKQAITQAKHMQADLVLFPEMFDIGYTQPQGDRDGWRAMAISDDDPYISHLRAWCQELAIGCTINYLAKGVVHPRNTTLLVDHRGETIIRYSKIHLYEPFENDACCEPGDEFFVRDYVLKGDRIRIGMMICADRDFPESARVLMKKGAEIILSPNACPLGNFLSDILRVRAIENTIVVATTNYPAPKWDGHSCVIDPSGGYLARCADAEEIRVVPVDLEPVRQHRQITEWGDAFRKEHAYADLLSTEVREPFKDRRNAIGELRVRRSPYGASLQGGPK